MKQLEQYDCRHGLRFSENTEGRHENEVKENKLRRTIGWENWKETKGWVDRNETWRDEEKMKSRNLTKVFKEEIEMVYSTLETDTDRKSVV